MNPELRNRNGGAPAENPGAQNISTVRISVVRKMLWLRVNGG